MKKIFLLAICILLVSGSSVRAASENGGYAGTLLNWGVGARSIGMGRITLPGGSDGSIPYWNPALMSDARKKAVTSMYASLLGFSQYTYVGLTWPRIGNETWGGYFVQLSSGEFEKTSATNDKLGSFSVGQNALALAYARQVNENFSVGVSSAYFSNSVADNTNSAALFDLSGYFQWEDLYLSGALKNVVAIPVGENEDVYPLVFRMGVFTSQLDETLLLGGDITRIEGGANLEWGMGGEYVLFKDYYLRAGFNSGDLYGGVGLNYEDFDLDTAIHFSEVEISYFFSFNYVWGMSRIEAREEQIDSHIELISESIEKGDFEEAVRAGEFVLKLDVKNLKVKEKVSKLRVLNEIYKENVNDQKFSTEKIEDFLEMAGKDYINEEEQKAINKLKYVLYLQPDDNAVARSLLSYLIDSDEEEDLQGEDIVGNKLKESLVNFYSSDFDKVIDNCNEVLQLDPENINAYLRKGSAYFMKMEDQKAIEAWQKVLQLDPSRKQEVERIIQRLRKTRKSDQPGTAESTQKDIKNQKEIQGISLGNFANKNGAFSHIRKLRASGFIGISYQRVGNGYYRVFIKRKGRTLSEMHKLFGRLKDAGFKAFWIKE